mmetsp:Transcript_48427/g.138397  ORF Transcript_48427/g.138397 Transcript_48427/m.138397 type:complete len:120 (+) Transcript_48427:681-1040(+)
MQLRGWRAPAFFQATGPAPTRPAAMENQMEQRDRAQNSRSGRLSRSTLKRTAALRLAPRYLRILCMCTLMKVILAADGGREGRRLLEVCARCPAAQFARWRTGLGEGLGCGLAHRSEVV